jgi:3-hydroxybutyryl-CoA dehydratase
MLELGNQFHQEFIVSESIHQGFVALFRDENPLHTNQDFAVTKGFQGKVMHGNILNGFLSYFIGECLPTKDVIIHSQEIQFKNAVYVDDVLAFKAEIIGVYESVNAIEFKFDFKNTAAKVVAKGKIQIGVLKS